MQTGLHNTISKVYRQLKRTWWKPWPAPAFMCAINKSLARSKHHPSQQGITDLDREVRTCVDGLLNAGCTLQQTRELLTREITAAALRSQGSRQHPWRTSAHRC